MKKVEELLKGGKVYFLNEQELLFLREAIKVESKKIGIELRIQEENLYFDGGNRIGSMELPFIQGLLMVNVEKAKMDGFKIEKLENWNAFSRNIDYIVDLNGGETLPNIPIKIVRTADNKTISIIKPF